MKCAGGTEPLQAFWYTPALAPIIFRRWCCTLLIIVPCTSLPLHPVCILSSPTSHHLTLPSDGAFSFMQPLDEALLAWSAHTMLATALQDMPRPFKKLREHDIDALAEEIAAALK